LENTFYTHAYNRTVDVQQILTGTYLAQQAFNNSSVKESTLVKLKMIPNVENELTCCVYENGKWNTMHLATQL
jgi:hypothetical protein